AWIQAGSASGPVAADLQAMSNAELRFVTQALPAIGAVTPSGGTYSLAQDVALFNFATVPGQSLQLIVPAPLQAIFGANSTIVDPTNALVLALIADVVGTMTDEAGNLVTAYKSGSKGSRRTEQL